MLQYRIAAHRIDARGGLATTKEAALALDTSLAGRTDAFNPAELFLAAIAACMIKGIERVTPMLHFELRGVAVELVAQREDTPPRIVSVHYVLTIDTDESEQRLQLLHTNVQRYGTIYNTVAAATELSGEIRRKSS